ncbi:hypothetical protein [Actinomyces naeslundii]|uniref:hypothetical protein n=1 Tax=Actinomyces naeslundii TaxID=1655 RepID=UPI003C705D6E
MAAPADHTEENNTPPTTDCPAWCIGHNADAPGKDNDHLHEATPALIPCIALERTTNETGTIHHHPTATELTLVRYQYPHDSDTWLYIGDGSRSHGLDITLESARRLVRVLEQYMAVAEEG